MDAVNGKTQRHLNKKVLLSISSSPNGKIVVRYYSGKVEWYINFYECFYSLSNRYNLSLHKTRPRPFLFAGADLPSAGKRDKERLEGVKNLIVKDFENILSRYNTKKMRYFKNMIHKELKEYLYESNDLIRLSPKTFKQVMQQVCDRFQKRYAKEIYIIDIFARLRSIRYDDLFD